MPGIKTIDLTKFSVADDIVVNRNGTTGTIPTDALATQLVAGGPINHAIADLEALLVTGISPILGGPVVAASNQDLSLTGGFEIDGITLQNGDRYLAKDQSDDEENGVYIYNSAGGHSRSDDMNTAAKVQYASIFVASGILNDGREFYSLTDVSTLDTDAILFVEVRNNSALNQEIDALNRPKFPGVVNGWPDPFFDYHAPGDFFA